MAEWEQKIQEKGHWLDRARDNDDAEEQRQRRLCDVPRRERGDCAEELEDLVAVRRQQSLRMSTRRACT